MKQLKSIRTQKGVTQKQLADYLGCTVQSIANYENGRRYADYETQLKIAEYFNVSLDFLLRGLEAEASTKVPNGFSPLPFFVKKPRLGTISCGTPLASEENFDGYDFAPESMNCDFTLKCEGDSMEGQIHNGDIVYIRQQEIVEDGQIAAVLVDGVEKLLKRVYITATSITLVANNPVYPPLSFHKEEMNRVQIIGRAVGLTRAII